MTRSPKPSSPGRSGEMLSSSGGSWLFRTVGTAALLFTACTHTLVLSPLRFQEHPSLIPVPIGLYLSPKTKSLSMSQSKAGQNHVAEIGKSLETNSKTSLGKIFQEVVPVESLPPESSDEKLKYWLELEITRTGLRIGKWTFSKEYAEVEILYRVRTLRGSILLEDKIDSEASRSARGGEAATLGAWALINPGMAGGMGASLYQAATAQAIDKALWITLEELNLRLLEKQSIFAE